MKSGITYAEVKKELLNVYGEGDFYISSPIRSVLGKGVFRNISGGNGKGASGNLSEQVRGALREARIHGIENPVAVGAIPFGPLKEPRLIVPETAFFSAPYEIKGNLADCGLHTYDAESIPTPEGYMEMVANGLDSIKNGEMDKIVLARSLRCRTGKRVDPKRILQNLAEHNAGGYTFAEDVSEEQGKARTFLGASPELLVSRSGATVIANPLAGSRPRSDDPEEDRRRAMELMDSAKDLHEHKVVVDAVREGLEALCPNLSVPDKPSVIQTETMWHLSTEIRGQLTDDSITSLDLALAIHPTPAICGFPADTAFNAIRKAEPFDRGYFTGIVGWCNERGDGEWIVAIRCAEVEGKTISLYAGAGVVAGSKPEEELNETAAKFRTMLNAIGAKEK